MVYRQSQATQLNTPQTVGIQQSQIGNVNPQQIAGKYQNPSASGGNPDANVLSGLVDVIAQSTQKLASHSMSVSMEEAYVAGAAHAETRQSEDTLASNPLTADWATAGWRDTMGKLALADSDAQSAVDLYKLKLNEKPPAAFEEYLTQKRNALTPQLEGMSLAQRKALMGQQVMQDRALIKQHGLAYNAHIVTTRGAALSANVISKFDQLNESKKRLGSGNDDVGSYSASTENAYSAVMGIWQDDVLPLATKQKLTVQAMENALGQDHQLLFGVMKDRKDLTDANGQPSSIRNMLEVDDQTKLNSAQRSSMDRTAVVRFAEYSERKGAIEGNMSDPLKEIPAQQAYRAFLNEGMQIGAIKTPAEYEAAWEKYTMAASKRAAANGMGAAVASGNTTAILTNGTIGEAVKAYQTQLLKGGNTLAQTSSKLLDTAIANGYSEAFSAVGEINGPGFRSMFTNPVSNQAAMQSVESIFKRIEVAKKNGQQGGLAALLSTLDKDTQNLMTDMNTEILKGTDPATAIVIAKQNQLEHAKLTPNQKAVHAEGRSAEIDKLVADFQPMGLTSSILNVGAKIVSGITGGAVFESSGVRADVTTAVLTPFGFGNSKYVAAEGMENSRVHYRTLLEQAAAENGRGDIETLALARLSALTIPVKTGLLVIDPLIKAENIPAYFGAKAQGSVDNKLIGKALDSLHTKPDTTTAYRYTDRGIMFTTRNNKDGGTVATGIHDPKLVGAKAEELGRGEARNWDQASGRGVSVAVPDAPMGAAQTKVNYNGENTALLDDKTMLQFRNNLVRNEQVRAKSYTVGNEKTPTNGIGFHGDYYIQPGADGTITPAQIQKTFIKASNDAAEAGTRAVRLYGVKKESGILLMSELAYHSGTSFYKKDYYQPFLNAVKAGDLALATAEFKKTPAWTKTPDAIARHNHYLTLLNNSLGG